MKDFSTNDFLIELDTSTAEEIEYTRDVLPHIFTSDSHFNKVWGTVPISRSAFKLTLTQSSVNKELEALGFKKQETSFDQLDEQTSHPMPANTEYKELFTQAIFKKAVRFISQNWNPKGIIAHFDEPLPNFHVFLDPTPTTSDDSSSSPTPKTGSHHKAKEVTNSVQPPQHQKELTLETAHRQFLQRQAANQQAKSVEEEKKKALQRKHKLQYRPPYWQNHPSQDGPDPS